MKQLLTILFVSIHFVNFAQPISGTILFRQASAAVTGTTWDPTWNSVGCTYSVGNTKLDVVLSGGINEVARTVASYSSGKECAELLVGQTNTQGQNFGIIDGSAVNNKTIGDGAQGTHSYGYFTFSSGGFSYTNGSFVSGYHYLITGEYAELALDNPSHTIGFYQQGTLMFNFTSIASVAWYVAGSTYSASGATNTYTINGNTATQVHPISTYSNF